MLVCSHVRINLLEHVVSQYDNVRTDLLGTDWRFSKPLVETCLGLTKPLLAKMNKLVDEDDSSG